LNSSGSAPISLRLSSTSDFTRPARIALFKSKSTMMCGKYSLRRFLPAPTSLYGVAEKSTCMKRRPFVSAMHDRLFCHSTSLASPSRLSS